MLGISSSSSSSTKAIGFQGGGGWGGSDIGAGLSLNSIVDGVGFDAGGASLTGVWS